MNGLQSDPVASPDTRILETKGLTKFFPITAGFMRRQVGAVRAVDDVDIVVNKGETLALVGESGSGKSTLGRMIVRAHKPTSGQIMFRAQDEGWVDLAMLEGDDLRKRRKDFHMIFQDPSSSLNPRMTVFDIVKEPLVYNKLAKGDELAERVRAIMPLVGLEERHLRRYPHAFSGGQRQRIGIARSLICNPELIVCDESVSALDVSIQAQILNLLKDLQEQLGVAYLFIAHDLAVVEHISHRVAVLYVGKVVETGPTEAVVRRPLHPYSSALLTSAPVADPFRTRVPRVPKGEIANPANPPSGCYFHPRCQFATELCKREAPAMRELEPGRLVACHHAQGLHLPGMVMDGERPAEVSFAPTT